MRWKFFLASILMVSLVCFLHSSLSAEDKKKEPAVKKAEPFKDVIVNGELINADLKDKVHTQSFAKSFTFKMEKGNSYQIEMGSAAFLPLLRLEDSSGNQIAQAFDQVGNRRAILLHQPTKTGDYQIVATTLNAGATGKFLLVIKDASANLVLSVNDKLNQNDKAYAGAGNKKHKLFFVNLEEGKTYQIDMQSKDFDSYLFFESPEGKLLAQDDDGGGYPSARIVHKAAKTGKYRVITTYFGGGGNLGEFNLTIRQTEGAAPLNPKRLLDKADGFKR